MKAQSDRVGANHNADPNAALDGVDSSLQVRIANVAIGTFRLAGPNFDQAPSP